jgi:hypothetical protein
MIYWRGSNKVPWLFIFINIIQELNLLNYRILL